MGGRLWTNLTVPFWGFKFADDRIYLLFQGSPHFFVYLILDTGINPIVGLLDHLIFGILPPDYGGFSPDLVARTAGANVPTHH